MKSMKILFAGGGTAGHINPALAVAGTIREKEPGAQILYVGAKGGMEERLVPQCGYTFRSITIAGFQRKLNWKNLKRNVQNVAHLFTSTQEAKRIIQEFKPDVCMGTGGYVSGPVIREAMKLGIPSVIHEQNAYPGVTNKALSKRAAKTMLAVMEAQKYLPASAACVLTGNPVRPEVIRAKKLEARAALGLDSRPLILSFGGSLGARRVNEVVADLCAWEQHEHKPVLHLHATGSRGVKLFEDLEAKNHFAPGANLVVKEYIDNMPLCLAAADLVICRAGAITLSELQVQGKASILIPSPNVAENHQYHNAMALVNQNAASILEEKDLSGETLTGRVEELFRDPKTITELGGNAKKMAILDANERIYSILRGLVN